MLNRTHHHVIAVVMSIVIFITGVLFGVKLSTATQGTQGMTILSFALSFLSIALMFILFTQLVDVRERITQLDTKKRKGGQ